MREDRKVLTNWILSAPNDSILSVTQTSILKHEPAKIRESMPFAFCGEKVMESRIQQFHKKPACIPCYEKRLNFNQNDQADIDNLRF